MISNTKTTDLCFGYGSNLDWQDWEKWCNEHGRDPNSVEALPGIYLLPDYELAFDYYSHGRGGGALDVVKKRGHIVVGKLFKLNVEGWKALDAKEGAPNYYERKAVQVLDEDGKSHNVITYVVTSDKKTTEHKTPTEEYVQAVLRGYDSHGITEKYPWAKEQLQKASLGRTVKSAVNHIFTYGTLREGEERSHIIAEFSEKMYKDCKVHGDLINLGSYPGLVRTMICESCSREVIGEIHYGPTFNEYTIKKLADREMLVNTGSHEDTLSCTIKITKEKMQSILREHDPPAITCEKCDEEIQQHYGFVIGEIHYTPQIQNALKTLDEIEGFEGYGEKNSLFDRILVQCDDKLCWTYLWAGSPDDGRIIESGDWYKR